jgi:RHS repeat-associated protein
MINRHFTAYDGNGNVTGLADSTTGKWSARYEYGPFGEVIRANGPASRLNPFRFSTKYQDDETDLLYYGYRYYNAGTGRWISRDPANEFGALVMMLEIDDLKQVKRILRASPEARLLLQNAYYRGVLAGEQCGRRVRNSGRSQNGEVSVTPPLNGFVSNDPVNELDVLGLLADPTDIFAEVEEIMSGVRNMLKTAGFIALCRCAGCLAAIGEQLAACAVYTSGDDWVRCSCAALKESTGTKILCTLCAFGANPAEWARSYIGCSEIGE